MSEVAKKPVPVDYPVGDGKPDCEHCKGRGVVRAKPTPGVVVAGELLQPCQCVRIRDLLANVERGWKGLSQAPKIPESPLFGKEKRSLWITATNYTFKAHLRYVALRNGATWGFVVVSDADLMDAWLSRVDDHDVYDGDVVVRRQPVTSRYGALVDLTEPPELLILIAGVKAARNSAMPEVFLEVLRHREHVNKPTWVVDQPGNILGNGHRSYDSLVGDFLSNLPRVKLKKIDPPKTKSDGQEAVPMVRRPTPVQLSSVGVQPLVHTAADPDEENETEEEEDTTPTRKVDEGKPTRSELDGVQFETDSKPKKWKGGKR